jgi:hypothetical protein
MRPVAMTTFRKLLFVTVGALALCGMQACSSGTELNPQPLPPSGDPRSPEGKGPDDSNGGSSGSTGTNPSPGGASDAGAEGGDAADGGDH